jgi:hypothetical protein
MITTLEHSNIYLQQQPLHIFRPHDTVGCWYNNYFVISAEHEWLAHGISVSKFWINKVKSNRIGSTSKH